MARPTTPRARGARIDTAALEAAVRLSGITHSEFAELIEVSRTTVFMWRTGVRSPHNRAAARVVRAVRALTSAADAGKLPLELDAGTPRAGELLRICRDYGL